MDRRTIIKSLVSAGALLSLGITDIQSMSETIRKRTIPSSGEKLPSVGVGTWQTFDVGSSSAAREPLQEVLIALLKYGGNVIDSSPMYGRSQGVTGDLADELGIVQELFMATKVWTTGKNQGVKQMERSMQLMKKSKMDLMQIHNLLDWQTHIKTLRDWKEQRKIRYIGITHYTESAYAKMERIMKSEPIDFIQLNYSINSRTAENRILPLAKDKGIAVLINRPFGGGSLFNSARGKKLPEWTKKFDCASWGQFFLKYLLSNEAVTCVIPGTSKPHHMVDNLSAGLGALPSVELRKKMIEIVRQF